jgi:hypothetical protein
MPHIVLLGDSIFDNGAYTSGGPNVITQLGGILPGGWTASLRALDGARTSDVVRQVAHLPQDTSHLVLSVGGNDALSHGDLLDQRGISAAQLFGRLAEAAADFESRYRTLIDQLMARRLPLVVCTIYNGNFPDPAFQRIASTALCPFNDAILRVAFRRGLTIIDLRLICSEPADYANPIEPSSTGGAKIAHAIAQAVGAVHPAGGASIVHHVPDSRTQSL